MPDNTTANATNTTAKKTVKDSIMLGSGHIYCIEANDDEYADLHSNEGLINLCRALIKEENKLAHIKGGATANYEITYYSAKDDLGEIERTKPQEDKASLGIGVINTIIMEYLEKLFPTVQRDTSIDDLIIDRIGGINNDNGKVYYFAFVNEDEDGDTIVLLKGKNTAALALAFQPGQESTMSPEIQGEPLDKNGRRAIHFAKTHGVNFDDIQVPAEEADPSDADDEPEPDTIPSGEDEPTVANDVPQAEEEEPTPGTDIPE